MKIEIASDVVCPWCYIGKRRLEKALELLSDVEIELRWLPFQLNPGMPKEGMPRAEYRKAKFGSLERSRELDARVTAEGKGEGIDFALDRIERTPNTSAAHQLIAVAADQNKVVDALFRAYFEEARDIGDPAVLDEIARRCGVDQQAREISSLEEEVRAMGITAVPTFILERRTGIRGAHPPEQLAAAIRQAASAR